MGRRREQGLPGRITVARIATPAVRRPRQRRAGRSFTTWMPCRRGRPDPGTSGRYPASSGHSWLAGRGPQSRRQLTLATSTNYVYCPGHSPSASLRPSRFRRMRRRTAVSHPATPGILCCPAIRTAIRFGAKTRVEGAQARIGETKSPSIPWFAMAMPVAKGHGYRVRRTRHPCGRPPASGDVGQVSFARLRRHSRGDSLGGQVGPRTRD
jgi:hypothetical protein